MSDSEIHKDVTLIQLENELRRQLASGPTGPLKASVALLAEEQRRQTEKLGWPGGSIDTWLSSLSLNKGYEFFKNRANAVTKLGKGADGELAAYQMTDEAAMFLANKNLGEAWLRMALEKISIKYVFNKRNPLNRSEVNSIYLEINKQIAACVMRQEPAATLLTVKGEHLIAEAPTPSSPAPLKELSSGKRKFFFKDHTKVKDKHPSKWVCVSHALHLRHADTGASDFTFEVVLRLQLDSGELPKDMADTIFFTLHLKRDNVLDELHSLHSLGLAFTMPARDKETVIQAALAKALAKLAQPDPIASGLVRKYNLHLSEDGQVRDISVVTRVDPADLNNRNIQQLIADWAAWSAKIPF